MSIVPFVPLCNCEPFIGTGVLELGAQWLHGQDGNPLYHYAKERDLISNPDIDSGIEGTGIFCTDSGQQLNNEDIDQVISYLNRIKDEISEFQLEPNQLVSAHRVFLKYFQEFIESEECPPLKRHLLWSLFEWFMQFEVIDNSCEDMRDISLLSYTQYNECDGIELINFKDGYQSVIDSLVEKIPSNWIRLSSAVKRIEICNKTLRLNLYIENTKNKTKESFDHLIITSSIGFLKRNLDTFFGFALPQTKVDIIKSIGFGTIDKIYLYFEKPFWKTEEKGFQLIWTKRDHNLPVWVYDITGFDLVRGQSNVLVAWIGGNGAHLMEQVASDLEVGHTCAQVLRLFIRNRDIECPSKVIRSKWSTNEYVCGAYSNRSLKFEALGYDIECLSEPITKPKGCPLVLFAGEATDRQHYSTTHGAMNSGLREAQRLITFYRSVDSKPKF